MTDLRDYGTAGQPASDWIEWTGGECPVDPSARVEVSLRNLERESGLAKAFDWVHRPKDVPRVDIIAYRIVSPTLPAVL